MSKVRAIIFDCYSTLIDIKTNEQKEEIFYYLSRYLQYYRAKMDASKLRSSLELEKQQYLQSKREDQYPEIDLEVVFGNVLRREGLCSSFLAESCCKLFRVLSRERLQLFSDSIPVLEEMKKRGYPVGVVSDAQKVFCLDEVEILGLNKYFKCILLSTYFGFRKPDPRFFKIACTLLNTPPMEAVYIGNDPVTDVAGAKQVGMQAILLDRDSSNRNREREADFYARNLWEAWNWIKNTD